MNSNPSVMFSELQTSIAEALSRSEAHMSNVQRQLAGWQTASPTLEILTHGDGWNHLLAQIEELTGDVDQELASIQTQLSHLVKQGREWKQLAAMKP